MSKIRKTIVASVIGLFLAAGVEAETLVYKWQMRGQDIMADSMEATNGVRRKMAQKGFLVVDFDKETSEYSNAVLYKYWKNTGTKKIEYSAEEFLGGEPNFFLKVTEKGNTVEITALGENYYGMFKKPTVIKGVADLEIAPKLKGSATWKNVFDNGKISTGDAKVNLSLDKNKTIAVCLATPAPVEGEEDPVLSEEDLCNILFNLKPHEYVKVDPGRSIYGGASSLHNGIFKFLAVGTDKKYYAFPANAGTEGTVLMFDDEGQLKASAIGSRDEYLLNRVNHYGSQKAETISDFRAAVEALLKDLDPETIIEITNQIDLEKLLERISEFLEEYGDKWISEHIDSTTIIEGMTAEDIEALIAKLKLSENWTVNVNYDNAEIDKILEAIKAYIDAGGNIDGTITKYLDPTTIINNMDEGDSTILRSKLGLVKNNFAATAAPTANDDTGDGYAAGSCWLDVTNEKAYYCTTATAGAAKWLDLTSVNAADITGLSDAINANGKLALISITKPINLDKFSGVTINDGDEVNLPNMKAAVTAILNYMHDVMGVAPQIYDPNNL